MAGCDSKIGNWTRCLSKSTGKHYYHNATQGQSLWEDTSLPHGWAWKKVSETSPKVYVNLITGLESDSVPTLPAATAPTLPILAHKRSREEARIEPVSSNTSILENELIKYFRVSSISSLSVAGRGKRSIVYRTDNKSSTSSVKSGLDGADSDIEKYTLKVQPFDERVAEEIEALKDASLIHERHKTKRQSTLSTSELLRPRGEDLSKLIWAVSAPLVYPVYSFIDSSKNYFIIMEDFGTALDTNERLLWENAHVVFLRMMLALKYLHEQNRLHCDVHAGNILVKNNDFSSAVLVDLGSSQKLDKTSRLYIGPTRGGRWDIMPPEQFNAGKGSVDVQLTRASDIYSAAATFVHLLSGSPPFAPPRGGKLTLFACRGHELRSLDAMKRLILTLAPKTVDMKFVDVLLRALHPDLKQRFETVDEVFESLGMSVLKEII